MTLLYVGIGGFFGAIARYLVDGWVVARTGSAFPWGTLAVNLSGSFVLGLLVALAIERGVLPADIRAPIMIGFIGAYTTFSTFAYETQGLIAEGRPAVAFANALGSVTFGVAAVYLGLLVARLAR